ncbi:hypothetical protein KSP40_PGU009629 [Platanthera guangdongensis]|uniref:Ribosomal protein S14 n=1 Tax=Platanthera guangdongensis TaxID=2320717 RepID=A0ABR2LXV5_9ASPA
MKVGSKRARVVVPHEQIVVPANRALLQSPLLFLGRSVGCGDPNKPHTFCRRNFRNRVRGRRISDLREDQSEQLIPR